ncbi:hypothetical protein GGE65_007692 [Skermanella aerolata]
MKALLNSPAMLRAQFVALAALSTLLLPCFSWASHRR